AGTLSGASGGNPTHGSVPALWRIRAAGRAKSGTASEPTAASGRLPGPRPDDPGPLILGSVRHGRSVSRPRALFLRGQYALPGGRVHGGLPVGGFRICGSGGANAGSTATPALGDGFGRRADGIRGGDGVAAVGPELRFSGTVQPRYAE